jgi:sugar lactone lactonase YvrE
LPAPEIFLKSDAQVGEGPIWSNGSLVWIDIPNGVINTTDISDGKTSIVKLDAIVGAVAPIENSDNYIVAMQEGFALSDGEKLTVIDPVLSNPHLRMNDAKCDALGRLWAGSCEYSFKKGMGALHRLENRGPSSIMSKGFGLPNGLGWTVNYMLVISTFRME